MSTAIRKYGNPSVFEKVNIFLKLLPLPVILSWALLTAPFTSYNRVKSWKRVLNDRVIRHLTSSFNAPQLQFMIGNTRTVYDGWLKRSGSKAAVDEIGDDARLFWVGPRNLDRVILYFHGGAYLLPMQDSAPDFWDYIRNELKKKHKDVGVAILNYSLVPTGTFPTQLRQAVSAIQYLTNLGLLPKNIQLAGDSAGGNLIIQVLSHLLHPLEDVPQLSLESPLGGAYLMSPWTRLTDKDGCLSVNDKCGDIISAGAIEYWGSEILRDVLPSALAYAEPNSAPEEWFNGVDAHVSRVLISAGGSETLRDEIIAFDKSFSKYHPDSKFCLQQYGIHDDPFADFATKEKKLGELTPVILGWLADGFD